jgi:hypothetical protein
MRIERARPSSAFLGAREPVDKTDAGAFPAPRTVAVRTRFSVVDSVGPAGRHQHRRSGRRWQAVELLVERAAALDVGKDEVVACIRVPDAAGGGSGVTPPGGPHLPDVHLEPGGTGRLAAGRGHQPGRDGLGRPRRARLRRPAGALPLRRSPPRARTPATSCAASGPASTSSPTRQTTASRSRAPPSTSCSAACRPAWSPSTRTRWRPGTSCAPSSPERSAVPGAGAPVVSVYPPAYASAGWFGA